nr:MAG TPA: Protein of unknown function (DUF1372) [Caudoviricetes sp.]
MNKKEAFIFFLAFLAIFQIVMLHWEVIEQRNKIKRLENQPKTIIYKVDNAGGIIDQVGKISAKNVLEGRYTVTIKGYGNFLVTKEQYDNLKVGDPIPDYLKNRGN